MNKSNSLNKTSTLNTKEGSNSISNKPSSIYILKTISLKKKTEETLRKEWIIRNIEFDKILIPYDEYVYFLESWGEKDFDLQDEDNCYFLDLDTALHFARNNLSDINDGGIFNYIAILKVDLERTYAMCHYNEAHLLKFNHDSNKYELLTSINTPEEKFIIKKLNIDDLFN